MIRINKNTLNEIISDFLKSGLDISIESFKEWFGIKLQEETYDYIGNKIYSLS